MPYVAARYLKMANDLGQITTDAYVYATNDVGKVDVLRVDAIDEMWQRYLARDMPISPFEIPTVTDIVPTSATVGDADLTLVVNGTDFTADSVIVFNSGEEPTTFVSATRLETIVQPSTAWPDGATVGVFVRTGTWETTPIGFTFHPVAPLEEPAT